MSYHGMGGRIGRPTPRCLPLRIVRINSSSVHPPNPVVGSGGGYSGLWTARIAKDRDPDRDVVLVEGREAGWGASGRNGGFCAASLTHGIGNGVRRWPDEMATLERLGRENLAAIRATYGPEGFNLGVNQGKVAGAGVEDHVHLHVVPRWAGDTNFMPVVGGARVLPQSLEDSYAALKPLF